MKNLTSTRMVIQKTIEGFRREDIRRVHLVLPYKNQRLVGEHPCVFPCSQFLP
jgi:hypothetical protein